jgi:predicted metalloprotease
MEPALARDGTPVTVKMETRSGDVLAKVWLIHVGRVKLYLLDCDVEGNQLSVRLELQADCLAGVWGYHADRSRQLLEEGDIEEALRAASSIGDDRLQRQSRGRVVPESFTHGSSEQRVRWFQRGVHSGTLESCNTFEVAEL